MAAVVALMACLWISEAVPLAATALLPLVLLPLLGFMRGREAAPFYVNSTIFLFLGGFMIGRCMEALSRLAHVAVVGAEARGVVHLRRTLLARAPARSSLGTGPARASVRSLSGR
ncbi:MAG: anion permease [Candidatus Latescibacterota bacterium]|nr:MAG: anion permease [Candidatus Latescibacterota bacterium]